MGWFCASQFGYLFIGMEQLCRVDVDWGGFASSTQIFQLT